MNALKVIVRRVKTDFSLERTEQLTYNGEIRFSSPQVAPMFQVLYVLIKAIEPFLVPICFLSAWAIMLMLLGNFLAAVRSSHQRAKVMHQIPCANCAYFTNDHRLKCPLHPMTASSEEAIGCSDYESTRPAFLDQLG